MVQQQSRSIARISDRKQEFVFLERSLNQDFNQGKMLYDHKNRTLTKQSMIDTINYKFRDKYVLRSQDTIHAEVAQIKCYLNGSEIVEGHVDAVEILFTEKFYGKELFVSKLKDATFYMNY